MKLKKVILIIILGIFLLCCIFFLVKAIVENTKYDASGNLIENVYIKNIDDAIYKNDLAKVK